MESERKELLFNITATGLTRNAEDLGVHEIQLSTFQYPIIIARLAVVWVGGKLLKFPGKKYTA